MWKSWFFTNSIFVPYFRAVRVTTSLKSTPETFSLSQAWHLLVWSKVLFAGALKIALPAIIAMLTVNLVMGVMTRASPQLTVFSVGFPVTMTVGFLVITASMPTFLPNFEQLLLDTFNVMTTIIRGNP